MTFSELKFWGSAANNLQGPVPGSRAGFANSDGVPPYEGEWQYETYIRVSYNDIPTSVTWMTMTSVWRCLDVTDSPSHRTSKPLSYHCNPQVSGLEEPPSPATQFTLRRIKATPVKSNAILVFFLEL